MADTTDSPNGFISAKKLVLSQNLLSIIRDMQMPMDACICSKCAKEWEVSIDRIISEVNRWQLSQPTPPKNEIS